MTELVHVPRRGFPYCGAPDGSPVSTDSAEVTCPECIEWLAMLTESHLVRHGARSDSSDGMWHTWCDELEWPDDSTVPVVLAQTPGEITCPGCSEAFNKRVMAIRRMGNV